MVHSASGRPSLSARYGIKTTVAEISCTMVLLYGSEILMLLLMSTTDAYSTAAPSPNKIPTVSSVRPPPEIRPEKPDRTPDEPDEADDPPPATPDISTIPTSDAAAHAALITVSLSRKMMHDRMITKVGAM